MRGITIRHILPSLYLILTTVVAIALALLWLLSPFALGFKQWPDDPGTRALVDIVTTGSYVGGIPLLIIAQITAIILYLKARRRAALILSTGAIICFYGCMIFVLSHLR